MGKNGSVYRKYINQMKKKTKEKNEGWSDKYKKVLIVITQKVFEKENRKKKNEEFGADSNRNYSITK